MANWKKFKKFVKKVAKPVAAIAAIVYPPLIPLIGSSLGATGAAASIVGAAALSGGASALAGDKPKDILKNAVLAGGTAGIIQAVSPTAFDKSLLDRVKDTGLLGGGTSAATSGGTTATTQGVSGGLMGSTLPATAGTGATTAASLTSEIASKGLIGDVVGKVASFTGLSPDTVGKLGSAAVQTLITSVGANKIADKATTAAQTQADATIEAAKIAADAAKFRPVGVTTRFGTSKFTTDAEGNVITAGYTPSAEITGYQDRFKTLAGQGLTDIEGARTAYKPLTGAAQSLFTLGQGYLAKSPEQAAQDYITNQRALLTPGRENTLAELQNKLFQQGRSGAAVAQGGNLMATSPELAAYYNSIATQDLTLASQADQEARDRITFGSGLFDTGANLQGRYYTGQTAAYAPFATAMDTSAGLESLAERPLTLGTSIGERTTAGTAAGGRFLSQGITDAAATMAPSNAFSPSGEALSTFGRSPEFRSALNNVFGVAPQGKTYTADEVLRLFGT
jgi:hypothetical protein